MPNKLIRPKIKKLPNLSISIESELAENFKIWCANNDTSVSREVRLFIIKLLNEKK